ncbi:MAG: PilZ domain-containing protein [Desulfobacterales bacterium]
MAHDDQKVSLTEVRGCLFELIFDMSEEDSRALKEELQKRRQSGHELKERRKHPRKNTFIYVDCSGNKCAFTDFIQNISDSGLYIETQIPLFPDQALSMILSPPGAEDPIKIIGKIVRVDSKGIGVQFDELLSSI